MKKLKKLEYVLEIMESDQVNECYMKREEQVRC